MSGIPTSTRGFLLVDRHVEKNAGSTFRELLFQNERRGLCMYWGYQQRSGAWVSFVDAMKQLNHSAIPPRICMEAHSHIDHVIPWLTRFEQLRQMRADVIARQLNMDVLLLLRLRQPLKHYISYYLWTVVERQARAPQRFGRTFEEWARGVPNLQTECLLSSKHAFTASFAPVGHRDLSDWHQRWGTPNASAVRRATALDVAGAFDILGTTERFDESNLLISRRLNWTVYDAAAPSNQAHATPQAAETCSNRNIIVDERRMWWCRRPGRDPKAEQRRVHALVCPDMAKCAQLIRDIAPVDHELYDLATRRLDAAVAAAGVPFQTDLAELKRLIKLGPALTHFTRSTRPNTCKWSTIRTATGGRIIGGPALEARNRRALWRNTPNFTRPEDNACVPGDNQIMRLVWSEHRMGGRISNGWPAANLVPMRGRAKGKGGGNFHTHGPPPWLEHKRMLDRKPTQLARVRKLFGSRSNGQPAARRIR